MVGLKIGFIGCGNIAQALAKGFLTKGITKPNMITAAAPVFDKHLLDQFKELGCNTTHNNIEVSESSDIVMLAVKPNVIPIILKEISSSVSPQSPLISSVALGVTIKQMESLLTTGSRVVRVMPNTPALVGLGASVYTKGTSATAKDGEITEKLLKSVGEIDEVPESYLDAITGLSGAGPAYMYLVTEALADGGVKMGLPRPLAIKLAAQTMMGAAQMVLSTGKPPGQLKDEVCSPGGCTIQGVAALENGKLRASLINAVNAATDRSKLISGQ